MDPSPAKQVSGGERKPADALAEAATAFKRSLGQVTTAEELQPTTEAVGEEERGVEQPVPDEPSGDEAPDDETAGEAPGSGAEDERTDETPADNADAPPPRPASWPAEQSEMWSALPRPAQDFIAARERQRDAAVQSKFEEAAQLRKAAEAKAGAEIEAANLSRARYAEAVDQVLGLVVPQPPPRTMLDKSSDDYDPDAYHYRKALHEDMVALLNRHAVQRQQIAAQVQSEQVEAINGATRDAFLRSVPDAADQAKAPAMFRELIDYAVSLGTPADLFASPTTALEWHVLWKAREYDRLQEAKARVRETPPPAPRKPQPALRPGVATARGVAEQQSRARALERLAREGSVDAGAAALRHLLKGNLS